MKDDRRDRSPMTADGRDCMAQSVVPYPLEAVSRQRPPVSAEEEVDVLLDAELQDDYQLAGVVHVPLEKWVRASAFTLVGDLLQARSDRSALGRRKVGAVIIGMIEEWRQGGGDVVPRALSAEAVHLVQREPLGLCQPPPERSETGVGPGDVRAAGVVVSWEQAPLEDRFVLIAAYWRTNLTLRQLARRSRRTPAPRAVSVGAVPGPS